MARQLEREVGTLLSTDPVCLPVFTPSARDSPATAPGAAGRVVKPLVWLLVVLGIGSVCLHVSQPVRCFEQPVCQVPEQIAAPSQQRPQPLCHRQDQGVEGACFLLYQHGQLVLLAC